MIIRKCDDKYIIKVFNVKDTSDIKEIKNIFKELIKKLKSRYKINGILDANIYINSMYGIIVELEELEDDDELDINMHIHICDYFLKIIDIRDIKKYNDVYYYKNNYYTLYDNIESDVIYRDIDDIIDNGIKVK